MSFFDYVGVLLMSFIGSVLGVFFWMWLESEFDDENSDNKNNPSSK